MSLLMIRSLSHGKHEIMEQHHDAAAANLCYGTLRLNRKVAAQASYNFLYTQKADAPRRKDNIQSSLLSLGLTLI